ncbi:hypothetical protein [Microvirga sp. VF16]|uniref:hypothetical protein n=1 Tax=Microvirga sp. VF16 TaxID=2807101 RepID=UPI00193CDECC|nr:hypothetical protein [Microvirga sp. VF16]QRM32760.1 hypothetical protein JO965_25605 [Microvirga sp. VF16]
MFQESFHNFRDEKIREAVARAEAISEKDLLSADLSAKLDEVANGFRFVVATLKPEGRRGKRRIETRQVRDYGDVRDVQVSVIDVTIPMEGYPKSLHIAPSHSNVIEIPASTGTGGLIATFYDDDSLDKNVDSFIARVSENLDRLRKEMEGLKPQIREAIGTVADRRLAEVQARLERDKTRSFPID